MFYIFIIFFKYFYNKAHGEDDVVVSHHWGIMSHRLLKDMVTDSTPIFKSIEVSFVVLFHFKN